MSPFLANLVLNEFDMGAGHALSKLGVSVKRHCDDIIAVSPTAATGNMAIEIIRDRRSALGLAIKTGTSQLVDTRERAAVWLGISFGPRGLSVSTSAGSPLSISCIPNQNGLRDSTSQKPFMFNYLRR